MKESCGECQDRALLYANDESDCSISSKITGSRIYIAKDVINIKNWLEESDWINYLTPTCGQRNIIHELGLSINRDFKITGHLEVYDFDDYLNKHELWFLTEPEKAAT
ncbi:MAG: hypothetical protein ACE3JK_00210 [Sporolactobacillus sp.]